MTLAEELEMLREENRQLKAALGRLPNERSEARIRTTLRVSPSLARLLLLHYRHETVSRKMAMDHLYGHSADPPYEKIIDVFICKLRRQMREAEIPEVIETIHGGSRRLTPAGRELVRKIIA